VDATELHEALPTDEPLPAPLVALCEYDEQAGGSLSCDFELTDTGQHKLGRYFGDEQLASAFAVFGADELLSFYAFWLHDGRTLANAPIVYLSGEAAGSTVLANTFEEFLGLLALGRPNVGLVADWDQAAEPCPNAAKLAEWLTAELGLAAPGDPKAVVESARGAHPDLAAWIDEHQAE
jgi:hypothetical protein